MTLPFAIFIRRLGVPEQALGGIPHGFGIVEELRVSYYAYILCTQLNWLIAVVCLFVVCLVC